MVLAAAPGKPQPSDPALMRDERYYLAEDVVYLYYTNGQGKTKLTNNLLKQHDSVRATTRN
jgi:hypothetical protein